MSEVLTRNCSRSQMDLAQQANEYLLEHMDRHITIRELSGRLHVSQTQLKNSFRNYFGNSVYKYVRARKLEKAANELASSDLSVMEIAGMCGYENCSKFAAASEGNMESPRAITVGRKKRCSENAAGAAGKIPRTERTRSRLPAAYRHNRTKYIQGKA